MRTAIRQGQANAAMHHGTLHGEKGRRAESIPKGRAAHGSAESASRSGHSSRDRKQSRRIHRATGARSHGQSKRAAHGGKLVQLASIKQGGARD